MRPSKKRRYKKFSQSSKRLIQVHRDKKKRRRLTTVYGNWSSSDSKCGTGHRGYAGKGIMEGSCTCNPEDWNNKSIKGKRSPYILRKTIEGY